MPDYYYAYIKKNWRFIVLDAKDLSMASNKNPEYEVKQYYNKTHGKTNNEKWNAAIGEVQQKWLQQELVSAETLNQKAIIFSHMPVMPSGVSGNLWNHDEIVSIIEKSPNVVAFINGHDHGGRHIQKKDIQTHSLIV